MNALEREVKSICESESENYDDGIRGFILDLRQGGCASGLIGELVYYEDTTKFYNKFENEIQELIDNYTQELGYNNQLEFISSLNGSENVYDNEQLKNLLAWFAFEETAFQLFDN
jgi:hypothetical protein